MKYFAIISVLILIITLVGVVMLSTVNESDKVLVEATGVVQEEASTNAGTFEVLQDQLRLGAVVGTTYTSNRELKDISNYQFITYVVRLRNNTTVDAELVEIQVTPMIGDVLQMGFTSSVTVPAGETADVSVTILTDYTVSKHPVRELNVSYYMWGAPFSMKTTAK